MNRALWIYQSADPLRSGELRRLGLPALLIEAGRWRSQFRRVDEVTASISADIVICPLRAAEALSITPSAAPVIIEVDSGCLEAEPSLGATLHALSNRIVGIVARSPRVSEWVERVFAADNVPIWIIPDAAAGAPELDATALRFNIGRNEVPPPAELPSSPFDLWFCEPGDVITEDQIEGLRRGSDDGPLLFVVAPKEVRIWLKQAGVYFSGADWSPRILQAAVTAATRSVFFGQSSYAQFRRLTIALRLGGAVSCSDASTTPANSPLQVGRRWHDLIDACKLPDTLTPDGGGPALVFADLVQDVDLVLPLLDELTKRGFNVRAVVSSWLQRRSPRLGQELQVRGVEAEIVTRDAVTLGKAPSLEGVGAIISPAESSLSAHARAHLLFKRARYLGIPTFSLQHGVENVGLSDAEAELQEATLFSDHLFTWTPPEIVPPAAAPSLRPRLRSVGRALAPPMPTDELRGALANFRSVVTVFENLHWNRYSRVYRNQFLNDCLEFAAIDPDRCVVLKPHHAGLWSVRHTHLFPQWPHNLVLADPADGYWEPFTASSLMALSDFVITTPSTVALDAVEAGKPVAVTAYGMSLPAYAPLPLLHSLQDWLSFASNATSRPSTDVRRRAAFLARTAWGERPVEDIIDHVCGVMMERAWARHRRKENI